MIKLATVFERNGSWYFQPSSRTSTGVWIATEPLIQTSSRDSAQHKGEAAIAVLDASRDTVAVPTDWNSIVVPLLTQAGVKPWSQFVKGAKSVQLEQEGEQTVVIPQVNLSARKGFEPLTEERVVLGPALSPDALGAALEAAMARSR